ncbi:MAG TPA: LPS assembly protein LptD, partial [Steroidobacter sp.]|nr:LPS assembly protein LptD [Steroidobacter sp.]
MAAAVRAASAQECADPPTATNIQALGTDLTDEPIDFQSDALEATREGELTLQGDVVISQGARRLKTRDAVYDSRTQSFKVDSSVEYSDPSLTVVGAGARVDAQGGATFNEAQFELPAIKARGSASRIRADKTGELELGEVRYTTCPAGKEDWVLRADDIDISQREGMGVGRGVRLDFMGVPLLYTPLISFPVGDERKSGFLFPSVGSSSNGYSLSIPWYWNIASNYDATFLPTWYSKRGARIDSEFRYLTRTSRGQFDSAYLPYDQESNKSRSFVHWTEQTDFTDRLRLDLDAANVSDDDWFQDFGLGPEGTSSIYLDRLANLTYRGDQWLAYLSAQNFQTINHRTGFDENGEPIVFPRAATRPHTVLPQLALHAAFPDQAFGLTVGLDAELANFTHSLASQPSGWRLDAAPEIRMPLRGAGVYLEPAARWRYTSYRLDQDSASPGDPPPRSAPTVSVDGGVVFERAAGSRQQRLQTF